MTRTLAAFAALGCLLSVASCGETRLSKSQYERRLLEIRERFEPDASRLYLRVVAAELPRERCRAAVTELAGRLAAIVDEIDRLRPPADVQRLQDEFVAAAERSVEQVRDAESAVEAGALRCGRELNDAIYGLPSTRLAERVLEELQRRGYRLGFE